ncbi:replication-relaxation family protein [Pseudonocardia nigra]|uniref:replication-relaxation family protein n=1 Tax=Pseudonocardia nigra TaxID=1921578 RepID=UPI001C5E1E5E|nr:replication-relaxation family protein [Pseudonocardia nigra]
MSDYTLRQHDLRGHRPRTRTRQPSPDKPLPQATHHNAGSTDGSNSPVAAPPPPARRPTRARGQGRIELLAAARRITPRDRWIIRMLHEHTVLTTTQLARLGFASLRAAQLRLRTLHTLHVVDRWQPFLTSGSAPMHHVLGPLGVRILAAEEGIDLAQLGYRRDRALAHTHRLTLAHDVGVNTFFTDLATHPHLTLTAWWSAGRCGRYFGHHAHPDGYATLRTRDPRGARPAGRATHNNTSRPEGGAVGEWEFFLEYDTGTEPHPKLAAKLAHYQRLAAATGIATPLLIWITRPRREPNARHALAGAHSRLAHPHLVPVFTATPQPSGHPDDRTPAGHVWLPLHPAHTPGRIGRRSLTELATSPVSARRGDPRDPRRSDPATLQSPLATRGTIDLPAPLPHPSWDWPTTRRGTRRPSPPDHASGATPPHLRATGAEPARRPW